MGQDQYFNVCQCAACEPNEAIHRPNQETQPSSFQSISIQREIKNPAQMSSLKNYIRYSPHMRDGHLDDFFAHQNQACTPSLGKMRLGKISDLGCLEDIIPPPENVARPRVEIIILYRAAITNILAPGGAKT